MDQTSELFFSEALPKIAVFDAWVRSIAPIGIRAESTEASRALLASCADHISYKCEHPEEFERIRSLLEPESEYVYQSYISGRRIALIKFREQLYSALGEITLLELSDQKPDGSQQRGFDHIEIYKPGARSLYLVQALETAGVQFSQEVRPHHTTYDLVLAPPQKGQPAFKLRLEDEPLIEKVKRDEFV